MNVFKRSCKFCNKDVLRYTISFLFNGILENIIGSKRRLVERLLNCLIRELYGIEFILNSSFVRMNVIKRMLGERNFKFYKKY